MAQPVDIPPDGGGTHDERVISEPRGSQDSSDKKSDVGDKSDNNNIDLVKKDSDSLVPLLEEDHNTSAADDATEPTTKTNR